MRALSAATFFAAASGFAILFVASWALGAEEADTFIAYWGLFFTLTGIIDGLLQETTRATSAAAQTFPTQTSGSTNTAKPVTAAGILAGTLVVLLLITSLAWNGVFADNHGSPYVARGLLIIGVASYVYQAMIGGILSGLKLWTKYSWLLAIDSGSRLLLAFVAWILGWGMTAFFVVTVLGAATWIGVLLCNTTARQALTAPTDVSPKVFAVHVLQAMTATGATAVLITGFPVFITTTAPHVPLTTGMTVAGIQTAVILTRAPILVPLQRFQSALIVRFVGARDTVLTSLAAPVAAVSALGLVGALLAWAIGPWVLSVFFPEGFGIPGGVLAILTCASAVMGVLMVTGTAALATNQHGRYVTGWLTAGIIAALVMGQPLVEANLAVRVCAALILGPAAGIAIHVTGLKTPQPQTRVLA